MNHGYNELQFLNLVLRDKQNYFKKYQIDARYFENYLDVYDFIVDYERQHRELPSFDRVLNTFDAFEATELDNVDFVASAIKRSAKAFRLKALITETAKVFNDEKDYDKAVDDLATQIVQLQKDSLPVAHVYDWAGEARQRYELFMSTARKEAGTQRVPTGFKRMDKAFGGGLAGGDVVVVFARMKNFKSWLGQRIGKAGFTAGLTGMIASLEMTWAQTGYRLDTLHRHFSNRALNEGDLETIDATIYEEYIKDLEGRDNHLYIASNDDKSGRRWSLTMIWETAERLGVDYIIIDQLSLLAWDKKYPSKTIAYDDMAGMVKTMATQLGIPVILLAQAGRGVMGKIREDKDAMPENEDLQWSDSIMQFADKGISVRKTEQGVVKTKITANRGGEEGQEFTFKWNADLGVVEDYDAAATKF